MKTFTHEITFGGGNTAQTIRFQSLPANMVEGYVQGRTGKWGWKPLQHPLHVGRFYRFDGTKAGFVAACKRWFRDYYC